MLAYLLLIIVLIILFKAYKKTGSFSGAIEYLKNINSNSKNDVQEESSTFEDEEGEDSNTITITRELTKNETKYLSANLKIISSIFILGSLINLSVHLDREIYIKMFDINIYAWYISLLFFLTGTLTFFKLSTKKRDGKILKIEGKAEIYTQSNIVHLGEYRITLPKCWAVKDGDFVSIEGYETFDCNVIALSMNNYSVEGSRLKSRGKWVMLSICLFINLVISGIIYDGGRSFYKLLAIYNISSESLIVDDYDSFAAKSFVKGQYVEIKNIDSTIVNNTAYSFRVVLPDSKGIDVDFTQIYYRLDKLKELQGTLMFNTLYYHDMEEMDFSFSNDFNKDNFTIFLENDYFLNALDKWYAYLGNEIPVDMQVAEAYLNNFIGSQIDIIKSQLESAIEEAISQSNIIRFYPMNKYYSYEMKTNQLYISFFNEPFIPEYKLDGYYYIKNIEEKIKHSDKFSASFFFEGYVDGEKSTNLKVDIVESDIEQLHIYYKAGIFMLSLILYLLILGISLRIKKLNSKSMCL